MKLYKIVSGKFREVSDVSFWDNTTNVYNKLNEALDTAANLYAAEAYAKVKHLIGTFRKMIFQKLGQAEDHGQGRQAEETNVKDRQLATAHTEKDNVAGPKSTFKSDKPSSAFKSALSFKNFLVLTAISLFAVYLTT